MDKIKKIRTEEKKYHEICYDNNNLFESGSWLEKPVKTVMELLEEFKDRKYINVLDLGCGIGRNSIPIAKSLKNRSGKIVCVDLLESAIDKLREYSEAYEVQGYIKTEISDVEHFNIEKDEFDFIVAVSILEHVRSLEVLKNKLQEMIEGTKADGIHCIVINTNVREVLTESNMKLDPKFEINQSTENMLELLNQHYNGWNVKKSMVEEMKFDIERYGHPVKLITDSITFAVQKGDN